MCSDEQQVFSANVKSYKNRYGTEENKRKPSIIAVAYINSEDHRPFSHKAAVLGSHLCHLLSHRVL